MSLGKILKPGGPERGPSVRLTLHPINQLPEEPAPAPEPATERRGGAKPRAVLRFVLLTCGFFLVALALQLAAGAYTAELGGYPDEPAHFTTGLMIHDYLAGHFSQPAMRFAEDFYLHYPKVALLHWPPVFYLAEALWLLLFPVSKASVLVLIALYTSLCSAILATWIARRSSLLAGCLTAALFVLTPEVQRHTDMVMVEMLLTLTGLLAAVSFGRFLETGNWRYSCLFGVFASLAILTKGNAWALALLPLLAVLISGRFRLLRTVAFWLPVGVVGLMCGPWQILTLHAASQGWYESGIQFTMEAIVVFASGIMAGVNPVVFFVMLAGIAATIAIPRISGKPADGGLVAMVSLMISVYVFHCVVPAGMDTRYMILGLPGLFVFLPPGVSAICGFLRAHRFTWISRPPVAAGIIGLFFLGQTFVVPAENSFGFTEAAAWLRSQAELRNAVVLISSAAMGEGMMVTEGALHETRPGHYFLRASKMLARQDWSGNVYEARFKSAEAVKNELDRISVGLLVFDFTRVGSKETEDYRMVRDMLAAHPDEWRIAGSYGPAGGDVRPVRIYRRKGDPKQNGRIRVDLSQTLQRVVEQK